MNLTISYTRDGDVHTINTGGAALGKIVIDNANVPENERGGTAKQLLGASALMCYCSALAAAMDARGVKYDNMRANAEIEVGFNPSNQSRVRKIIISAAVTLSEDDEDVFERIKKIMSRGCLVTSSLHEGIDMEYHLEGDFIDE